MPNKTAHTYRAQMRCRLVLRGYVCAVFLGNRPRWPCPFHPISLLLRKETGWSPKETRFWWQAEAINDSDAREVD